MNAVDCEDSTDQPWEFWAATVQVYDFAAVRPDTVIGVPAPVAVFVVPPEGLEHVAR
jgi:hypothetical protein